MVITLTVEGVFVRLLKYNLRNPLTFWRASRNT